MGLTALGSERFRRMFTNSFSVADVAEAVVSFDETTATADVVRAMDDQGYEIVGVRVVGKIAGYVVRDELVGDGQCGEHVRPLDSSVVIPDWTDLPTLVGRLVDQPRLFVTMFGQVGGIVTRTDLQKPPIRMWLFGVITIVEMGLGALSFLLQSHGLSSPPPGLPHRGGGVLITTARWVNLVIAFDNATPHQD